MNSANLFLSKKSPAEAGLVRYNVSQFQIKSNGTEPLHRLAYK
ncbi:hypothetical protein G163CM_44040 [Pseudocitrobacter corydidari]|uniref:Uncharacterized protein n=1 Tax=Pseudocitrobacter corydidari TaxID=2891570 RepID=A0ABY3SA33_9ENTR|nr:hypothetical protein G163CM_44040 [Pseudocitrobacter corydidari]